MGRDDQQHDAPEEDDGESHAADEPTAVWDESTLRAAGLGDLWRKKEDGAPSPAVTVPKHPAEQSIVIEENLEPPAPVLAKPFAQQPSGFGWGATIGIALALGAVAYALIRYLQH